MQVTFDTALLSAAIAKAARVAPSKGAAFDKSAGISMELSCTAEHACVLKSTDLEVTYLEWVTPIHIAGDDVVWRLPAALITGIIGNLPSGNNQTVTLDDSEKGYIKVKSGKAKAKIRYLTGSNAYQWVPFDETNLKEVEDFPGKVAQVSWACDKNMIPYTGVHINGTHLIATDRYRLARVPCVVPLAEPITVPLEVVAPILRNIADAKLGVEEKKLMIVPDEFSQITAVIFDAKYGDVARVMRDQYDDEFDIDVATFRDALMRMMVLCKGERYPLCRFTIGGKRIHILMDVPEVGEMEDELELDGADHDDWSVSFTPTYITDALGGTTHETIKLAYDRTKPNQVVRLRDKDEYNVWIIPRVAGKVP